MKRLIEFLRNLFRKEEKCALGCGPDECLMADVIKEIAAIQKREEDAGQEKAFLLKETLGLQFEVARLTIELAKRDAQAEELQKEMAQVIMYIAKEEAK